MILSYIKAFIQSLLNIKNWKFDNGIDLEIGSSGPVGKGNIRNTSLSIQLKSTECWNAEAHGYIKYDIPVNTYNQLRDASVSSQYLVLFTLPSDLNSWVKYQWKQENHEHVIEVRHMAYYVSLKDKPAISNTTKISIEW